MKSIKAKNATLIDLYNAATEIESLKKTFCYRKFVNLFFQRYPNKNLSGIKISNNRAKISYVHLKDFFNYSEITSFSLGFSFDHSVINIFSLQKNGKFHYVSGTPFVESCISIFGLMDKVKRKPVLIEEIMEVTNFIETNGLSPSVYVNSIDKEVFRDYSYHCKADYVSYSINDYSQKLPDSEVKKMENLILKRFLRPRFSFCF